MYSIIFPNYDPDNLLEEMTNINREKILDSIKGKDVEFIEVKNVKGFPSAVNQGLRQAKGDYLILVNNDISIDYPNWLEELCNPNILTSYSHFTAFTGETIPHFALISIPRNIYETVGDFDTQFDDTCGFDDIDYYWRARQAGFGFRTMKEDLQHHFKINHEGSKTFRQYYQPEEIKKMRELGMKRIINKYKTNGNTSSL